jgi:hypothetical protein
MRVERPPGRGGSPNLGNPVGLRRQEGQGGRQAGAAAPTGAEGRWADTMREAHPPTFSPPATTSSDKARGGLGAEPPKQQRKRTHTAVRPTDLHGNRREKRAANVHLLTGRYRTVCVAAVFAQLPHFIRMAQTAVAMMCVLAATFGIHLHLDHDHGISGQTTCSLHDQREDHHGFDHEEDAEAVAMTQDPFGNGTEGDTMLHAHGSLMVADTPTHVAVEPHTWLVATMPQSLIDDRMPDSRSRDIDPPPNKRVL